MNMDTSFPLGQQCMEALFAMPHVGFCIISAPGEFVAVNDAFCRLFGYAAHELIGKQYAVIIPEERRDEAKEDFLRFISIEEESSREWETVRKDGKKCYVLTSAIPFQNEKCKQCSIVAVSDITQLVNTRDKLTLIERAFENATEGIIITDTKPKILKVNQGYTKITGYSQEELLGNNPSMMRSNLQNKEIYEEMWTAITKKGFWQGEIWDRRKNGENYAQFLSVSTAYDEKGNPKNYIGIVNDITDIKRFRDRLHYLTNFDPLTKLPNRNLFVDRTNQAIPKAKRTRRKVALCFINVDRFNIINQSFSHLLGDEVLRRLANRLSNQFRKGDTIAYFGGDTFVLLLEDITVTSSIMRALGKIQDIFTKPLSVKSHEIVLTASVGVSVFPDDGDSTDILMKNAELAINMAKREGGNTRKFYSKEMDNEAFERIQLENDLRKAVAEKQFFIEYQPQLRLSDKKPFGSEALVRWKHPDYGIVPPGRFIPLAEETGLITNIGQHVLYAGCFRYKKWLDEELEPGTLSVNLSAVQFANKNLVESISAVLEETQFPPEKLEAEITESTIMGNVEASIIKLKELKNMGISVAVDDFGTGYSSLSYLKKFPIDKLKIDRSFIMDIPRDQDDVIIAKMIIQLSHNLRIKVIAEGIETEEQLQFLEENGCDEVQGFYYSKPLVFEKYKEYFSSF